MPHRAALLAMLYDVVHAAAGPNHTICATAKGSVFTWGGGETGALGLGDGLDRLVPTLMQGELHYKQVEQVAAGDEHSACVTADGSVYAWGVNAEGRLGVGDTKTRMAPTCTLLDVVGQST